MAQTKILAKSCGLFCIHGDHVQPDNRSGTQHLLNSHHDSILPSPIDFLLSFVMRSLEQDVSFVSFR